MLVKGLGEFAQRRNGGGSDGQGALAGHTELKLFGQCEDRVDDGLRAVVVVEFCVESLKIDPSIRMKAGADFDMLRVEAKGEEGMAEPGRGIAKGLSDTGVLVEQRVEVLSLFGGKPEDDPLLIDAVVVSDAGVFVGSFHIHGDPDGMKSIGDGFGPAQGALLELEAWTGKSIGACPFGEVGVEVAFVQLEE